MGTLINWRPQILNTDSNPTFKNCSVDVCQDYKHTRVRNHWLWVSDATCKILSYRCSRTRVNSTVVTSWDWLNKHPCIWTKDEYGTTKNDSVLECTRMTLSPRCMTTKWRKDLCKTVYICWRSHRPSPTICKKLPIVRLQEGSFLQISFCKFWFMNYVRHFLFLIVK